VTYYRSFEGVASEDADASRAALEASIACNSAPRISLRRQAGDVRQNGAIQIGE